MTYPRKDKYKSRHIVKKGENGYKRRQSRHKDAQRRVMDTTNNNSRQNIYRTTQARTFTNKGKRNRRMNQENPNKRTTREKRWTIMRRKWNCLYRQQDLCSKKQTTSR